MSRFRHTLTATACFGAALMLGATAMPAAAQQAVYLSPDSSRCDIFRALSEVVPGECAQAGDTTLDGAPLGVKTRGINSRGIRQRVKQASAPKEKAIAMRVQFAFDSYTLTPEAKDLLDRVASVLGDDLLARNTMLIEGHADATGSDAYNLVLSQERARSVRQYLASAHGLPADRLPFLGKGESDLYDAANPRAAINRRVEITNVGG